MKHQPPQIQAFPAALKPCTSWTSWVKSITINKQCCNKKNKDQIENRFVQHCLTIAGEISAPGCSLIFPPFDFAKLFWVRRLEGSSRGASVSCRPQGPHGSAGDSSSASQPSGSAAEGCCRACMPGQTTQGFNTGSCFGASSSWSHCPALRSKRRVCCFGQDGEQTSRSQTPKEALESAEPLTKK